MANNHAPAPVDPESLKRAAAQWDGFVQLMKYGTISVIVILVGMAVFLL